MRRSVRMGLGGTLAAALGACALLPKAGSEPVHHLQAPLMHTQWDFHVPSRSQARAEALVREAAKLVESLDQRLAMWRPDSELATFNATAGSGRAVTVSADLDACLNLALELWRASQGAFDPTVGPLTQAWWRARQESRLLTDAELEALLPLVGADGLRRQQPWEPGAPVHQAAWRLERPGMQVDLGAVAKGHAQDRVAALFASRGLRRFLLNAGGQVYARGRRPDGRPWRVGIQHPRHEGRVAAILELEDACLSTSGDNSQFSVIKGQRVHHLLDPRTGRSVEGMASASALVALGSGRQNAGALSDAASTAAFVLGPQQGLDLWKSLAMEGLVIAEDPSQGLVHQASPGLAGLPVVLDEP